MRIILFGPPGSGKGTQSAYLAMRAKIPLIATGDTLRAAVLAKSPLGCQVKRVMESGELVSDQLIVKLMLERLAQPDCRRGFLLDGFPRTRVQANSLKDNNIVIDYVVELVVAQSSLLKRLTGRLVHPVSGRVYHAEYNPPKRQGLDNLTGEPLIKRKDDCEETVYKRLQIYHKQTEPLTAYYQNCRQRGDAQAPCYLRVDGDGDIEQVSQRLGRGLGIAN